MDENSITGALFAGHVPDDFVDAAMGAGRVRTRSIYGTTRATSDRVREAHRAGLGTMARFRGPTNGPSRYVDVGNEDDSMYRTVLRTGVGGVCVNRPDLTVKVLRGMQRAANEEKKHALGAPIMTIINKGEPRHTVLPMAWLSPPECNSNLNSYQRVYM